MPRRIDPDDDLLITPQSQGLRPNQPSSNPQATKPAQPPRPAQPTTSAQPERPPQPTTIPQPPMPRQQAAIAGERKAPPVVPPSDGRPAIEMRYGGATAQNKEAARREAGQEAARQEAARRAADEARQIATQTAVAERPPVSKSASSGLRVENTGVKTLIVESLQKSYNGRRVVDGVSFYVRRGEVVGLLGRNGAGKTTSFDMVLGLVKPEKGKILLENKDLSKLPIHMRSRHGIGYLPQENSIFRKLTVADNMRLIMEMNGVSRKEQDRRRKLLLGEFGLDHLEHVVAVSLSGGERRRLELARCLASEPEFILLDEPFTGVDPISISDIQGLIRRLRDEWNLGVLLTDHNPRATLKITDRAYLIDSGKILVAGTSQEVADSPVARKQYLGEDFVL